MSTAAATAPARVRAERGPATLLPTWVARLVGFAALACLGAAQWQRMVAGLTLSRAVLWVALAAAAAAAVVACDRLAGRRRSLALVGVAFAGAFAAYLSAGLDLELLRPRRLDDLASGLGGGAQALSTVRLPYEGADPWPALTLQFLGSGLIMIAAMVAFWPREEGVRGYPYLALAVLLVLAASPLVSMGETRPLWLGAGLTLLTVAFLWLEKLPLRPGIGVAALIGLSLAGALPLASAADRGEPWFDYQSFAEGLGPKDPVRFDWGHGDYGPISWSRSGAEIVRIKARRPAYWKVRTLDDFDGENWDSGGFDRDSDDPTLDLPANWATQTRFQDRIQVSVQRLRGSDVVGAGTTVSIDDATRPIQPGVGPGEWRSTGDLRTGDSYSARVFLPRPTPEQLAAVPAAPSIEQMDDLNVRVDLDPASPPPADAPTSPLDGSPPQGAEISFPPFGRVATPVAEYRSLGELGDGDAALRASNLSRMWGLSQRLHDNTSTPYEYVLAVSAYLRRGFTYTEKPPPPDAGVHPLEAFVFDNKAGYCQHYAAATALLLRMGGIPARVATGFSPGGYSKRRAAWIVRDTDAHSWVEAWFDGIGWVTIDTTPSATPARSQIAALAAPASSDEASAAADAAANADDAGGTNPADPRAAGSREELFNRLRSGDSATAEEAGESADGGGGVPLWAALPVALVLAGGAGALFVRHRRRLPDDPLDRAVYELETALRRSGRGMDGGMTLRQLERRLGLSGEAAAYLRAVSAGRYAPSGSLPTNAQRKALRRELSTGQGFAGRLRTFWALPPRAR